MYTIQQVMNIVYQHELAVVIMAFTTYAFGFAQYISSMVMQIRDKKCPFYFWQHAWYFGHDLTFSLLFRQWFYQVHFWLFEVLWAGCVIFVGIELVSIFYSVKYERNIIWKKYLKHDVSLREGWTYGTITYLTGFALFALIRAALGDVMCLILMMSTNATLALVTSFKLQETNQRQKGTIALGWFIVLGTIFTFMPKGIGFFATAIPALNHLWFYLLGVVCVLYSIRYLWVGLKLPKLER
ncbi:hypothetical protein [Ligilactobacillus acidipiscis]|uniref:hypothetical protein n=1 Tax=Ligilactobacillus acidipiscis TaxID=89059 RepID=UPI0022E1BA0B|nr:hypothetical protein [Ligilactobacillus acidipiscis]WEV57152.1 hypothetical protein OZX66_00990 [Ligilactobacillus acidipiscis]